MKYLVEYVNDDKITFFQFGDYAHAMEEYNYWVNLVNKHFKGSNVERCVKLMQISKMEGMYTVLNENQVR